MVARLIRSGGLVIPCAAVSALAAPQPLQGPYRDTDRPLATRPAFPPNVVDDVRRPGANGMLWESRGYIGDPEGRLAEQYPQASASPGPATYGAAESDWPEVWARVGQTAVGINAWEPITQAGHQNLERARVEWLKENGYTGGVRTFTNPAFGRSAAAPLASAKKKLPEPRAVFELPPDMPRFKKRQEVKAAPLRAVEPQNHAHTIVVVRSKDDPAALPAVDRKGQRQVVVKPAAPDAGAANANAPIADAEPRSDKSAS